MWVGRPRPQDCERLRPANEIRRRPRPSSGLRSFAQSRQAGVHVSRPRATKQLDREESCHDAVPSEDRQETASDLLRLTACISRGQGPTTSRHRLLARYTCIGLGLKARFHDLQFVRFPLMLPRTRGNYGQAAITERPTVERTEPEQRGVQGGGGQPGEPAELRACRLQSLAGEVTKT